MPLANHLPVSSITFYVLRKSILRKEVIGAFFKNSSSKSRAGEPKLNSNTNYVDQVYNEWLKDPNTVNTAWGKYFRRYQKDGNSKNITATSYKIPTEIISSESAEKKQTSLENDQELEKNINDNLTVQTIIRKYQDMGHLSTKLDPLGLASNAHHDTHSGKNSFEGLNPEAVFKLSKSTFIGGTQTHLPLQEIVNRLEKVYCNRIGVEFMFINSIEQIRWIRQHFETPDIMVATKDMKLNLLERLIASTGFEDFLAKKYPGEKRFGIEGCEAVIPGLRTLIDVSSECGVESFIIGMAHRGRLNTLANVCLSPLSKIFSQFAQLENTDFGTGDVKYHLGKFIERFNRQTNKSIRIAIVANPSHLEAVNPVVQGKTRAEQFYRGDKEGRKVVSILIHGDASFCGQGVVFEAMHLSDLPDYTTHGTIHLVINNQIGFTTDPRFSRSSPYCTDVGRIFRAPIFHVNADDPEAVIHVSKIAAQWRAKFRKDVVVDIVGYRRMGHNETDEPMFTQPLMYKHIEEHKRVLDIYAEKLISEGIVTADEVKTSYENYQNTCSEAFEQSKKETTANYKEWIDSPWTGFFEGRDSLTVLENGVKIETLKHIGQRFSSPPLNAAEFEIHKGLIRIFESRQKLVEQELVDWALGEAMAFGSLLKDGIHVRLSGQDVERGTFSHRHHVLHHQNVDKSTYTILNHLYPDQALYTVSNSSLSEYAVLGFELGYSMTNPNALVIWEAQFGDFMNTAQCMIDQFISSGESKWIRQSGIVMLLPHGMEGMGPEHSSSRPERFLQLCSDDADVFPEESEHFVINQLRENNWIIANVTTPANYFHILRRQVFLPFRKPLIIMTPKYLLRHPKAQSSFSEMIEGTEFCRIIPETGPASLTPYNVKKLIFCSGKCYYDLLEFRESNKLDCELALVRIEQISPFPFDLIQEEITKYPKIAKLIWFQEEHKNQGCWTYVSARFPTVLKTISNNCKDIRKIMYVGRAAAASTSTGSKAQHIKEQEKMMQDLINI